MKSRMFLSLMLFIKKFRMPIISLSVMLTVLLLSFAQEDTPEEYIVKIVYFVSKDREPRKDADTQIGDLLKDTQTFYADQMENYGYGRKTFRLETDANGNPVVHHVIGKKEATHYQRNPALALREFANRIQTRNTILFVALDHGSLTIGGAGGVALPGERILVPASNFGLKTAAHELGHAFTLHHDFRNASYIMSWGRGAQKLSRCAASWLNVSPYLNPIRSVVNRPGQIKLLPSSIAYPPHHTHAFFEITDPDGLHQARYVHYPALYTMLGCQTLNGEKDFVKLLANTVRDEERRLKQC